MTITIQYANPDRTTKDTIELEMEDDHKFDVNEHSDGTISFEVTDSENNIVDSLTIVLSHVAYYRVQDKAPVAA